MTLICKQCKQLSEILLNPAFEIGPFVVGKTKGTKADICPKCLEQMHSTKCGLQRWEATDARKVGKK